MNDAPQSQEASKQERILFVTGRLAEPAVQRVVEDMSQQLDFQYEISVLGVTVAALMHSGLVKRRLKIDSQFDRVILPGWCNGDLQELSNHFGIPFERGPKDIFKLPEVMGAKPKTKVDLSKYDIEILAEINHAPSLSDKEILEISNRFRDNGANLIDLGCIPGHTWNRIGDVVKLLKENGHRISVDSFDRTEVEAAVQAGAELVLSCNGSNVGWAKDLPVEFVVIPDTPDNLNSLDETIQALEAANAKYRIDPILEPIGFGFAASLLRYFETRSKYPNAAMMMGIGNLTELVEVDSSGVNMLLAGICQELKIFSVLTTEVIHWGQTAVKEFDLARRMVRYSINEKALPKHIDSGLVTLRDGKPEYLGTEMLSHLASEIKDRNFRIYVESDTIHILNSEGHWFGSDPYEIFDRLIEETKTEMTPQHAFYLGSELSKARTALTLGKRYTQDHTLQWGFLTVEEVSALERRHAEAIENNENND